jgi:hypothetical protein
MDKGPEHTAQHSDKKENTAKVYLQIFAYSTLIYVLVCLTVWVFIRVQDPDDIHRVVQRPHIEALVKPHQLDVSFELGHDNRVLHEKENKTLDGYTWTDKSAGTVSEPIDKAIDQMAGTAATNTSPAPESGENPSTGGTGNSSGGNP